MPTREDNPAPEVFDPSRIDAAALEALLGSGVAVFVHEDSSGQVDLVTAGGRIAAPRESVWRLLTDATTYSEWMPQVKRVRTTDVAPGTRDVHIRLELRVAMIGKTVDYTLRQAEEPPSRITWRLVDGPFAWSYGMWSLLPATDPSATLAFYSTRTDLASMGWIAKKAVAEQPSMAIAFETSSATMVIRAVRQRLAAAE